MFWCRESIFDIVSLFSLCIAVALTCKLWNWEQYKKWLSRKKLKHVSVFLIKMVSYPSIVWIINKRRTRITKNFINAPAFNRINTVSNRYHCNSWTLWLRISFKLQFYTNFVDTLLNKCHLPLSSCQRWMPPEFKLQWHRNRIRVVRPSVWNITELFNYRVDTVQLWGDIHRKILAGEKFRPVIEDPEI